jgi:hypothetical protein
MESTLIKRIAFFTNIYLFLVALSVLVWLNKWDSEESTQELECLIALQNVEPLEIANLTPVINQKAAEWIAKNDTSEHENVIAISERFSQLLNRYGINFLEGYSYPKDTSLHYNPKLFALFNVTPILHDTKINNNYALGKTTPSNATISNLMAKATYMASQTKIQYVISFNENLLKYKLDSIIFSDHYLNNQKRNSSRKDSLIAARHFFSRMQPIIGFVDTSMYFLFLSREAKSDLRSTFINAKAFEIPVKTKFSEEDPSIITLLDKEELNDLNYAEIGTSFIWIKENYCGLLLSDAIKHLSEESLKTYKSINIFGFEFSKRRLPWAFGFFCLVAALGIEAMVDEARKRGFKILSDMNGDHIANLFIEDKWLRFIIWCITPLFIMYSSSQKLSLPNWNNLEYYLIIGMIIFLTGRAFIRSLNI